MFNNYKIKLWTGHCVLSVIFILVSPSFVGAETLDQILIRGDKAYLKGDFSQAEKIFLEADRMDPGNWRILKSLSEALFKQGKFAQAEPYINKILAMPVSNGRDVLVTLQGQPEPLKAELVDETVVTPESGQNNMRNYVDLNRNAAIPHYRFFFKKAGKMKLVPKYRSKFKYTGVRLSDYEMVKVMKTKVQKKIIAATGGSTSEMIEISAGCFQMGSTKGDTDEQPVHEVCLSGFAMDKTEVTQGAFQATMDSNPSQFTGVNHPVDSVTWYEAEQYCRQLGKRLPTEAEWEYAARAGTSTVFYWGDQPDPIYANFCDRECDLNVRNLELSDGFKFTAPVGKFKPNAWGFHDMAGNVSEWTADFMQETYYRESPKEDPKGSKRQKVRKVYRGGAWNMEPHQMRMANRKAMIPNYRPPSMGLRCVKDKGVKKELRESQRIIGFP